MFLKAFHKFMPTLLLGFRQSQMLLNSRNIGLKLDAANQFVMVHFIHFERFVHFIQWAKIARSFFGDTLTSASPPPPKHTPLPEYSPFMMKKASPVLTRKAISWKMSFVALYIFRGISGVIYYRPPSREFNNATIVASNWFSRSMVMVFHWLHLLYQWFSAIPLPKISAYK